MIQDSLKRTYPKADEPQSVMHLIKPGEHVELSNGVRIECAHLGNGHAQLRVTSPAGVGFTKGHGPHVHTHQPAVEAPAPQAAEAPAPATQVDAPAAPQGGDPSDGQPEAAPASPEPAKGRVRGKKGQAAK
jgi:hypothetical protein